MGNKKTHSTTNGNLNHNASHYQQAEAELDNRIIWKNHQEKLQLQERENVEGQVESHLQARQQLNPRMDPRYQQHSSSSNQQSKTLKNTESESQQSEPSKNNKRKDLEASEDPKVNYIYEQKASRAHAIPYPPPSINRMIFHTIDLIMFFHKLTLLLSISILTGVFLLLGRSQ